MVRNVNADTMVDGATDISKYAFDRRYVRLSGIIHVEIDLLNNKEDIWSSKGKVL